VLQYPPCKGYYEVVQRQPALLRLQELTQDQWGLVTRQQLREAGVGNTTLERLTAPGGGLDRVATGVYRLIVAPIPDNLYLRAAWLQLAPGVPAWERTADQGVVSHRSAAAVYGLGHFPADRHEFTMTKRKQTRRPDVRVHHRLINDRELSSLRGLPVTRPSRIASDLLRDHEDPEGIAQLIADAIRLAYDDPGSFANSLAPHAARFGLAKGAGLELLGWFLDLASDPEKDRWMDKARAQVDQAAGIKT
jgi:predicted transcriptional regulator of viral defense system